MDRSPILWLLAALAVSCGAPFFAVATSGPLLQRWFSLTPHPQANDPYFLYAASNTGSVLALLAYPFALEWLLPLHGQQTLWIAGYTVFALGTLCCAGVLLRLPPAEPAEAAETASSGAPPPWPQKLRWVALAAVPSSLVLGVTQYISTDVAAIPLLWVLPLAIYLLTFVAAFSPRLPLSLPLLTRLWAITAVVVVLSLLINASDPILLVMAIHLGGLAVAGLLCHRRLAEERPAPQHLTGFYLLLSLGGALGGCFNALLGPLLFDTVLEYPLALAAVSFLVPARASETKTKPRAGLWLDLAVPLVAALTFLALNAALRAAALAPAAERLLGCGVPLLLVFLASSRRLGFALGLAALLLLTHTHPARTQRDRALLGADVEVTRTFFGVHRINHSEDGNFVSLLHGSTLHGLERRDLPGEPLLYYHRRGPAGSLLRRLAHDPRLERVGLIGMGCGSLAAYNEPGQRWTFYEIDPEVVRLAQEHFGFLARSRGKVEHLLGDGRLALERHTQPGELGLLVLDAFSSDAIPTHLLTREAFALYFDRLQPSGLLLLHVSNRYFDLAPIVATLSRDAGLAALHWPDLAGYEDAHFDAGLQRSHWILVARSPEALRGVTRPWRPLSRHGPLWTDDYTNLLSVLGKEEE